MLLDSVLQWDWAMFADAFAHLVLPTLVLALSFLAMICRLTRAGMLDVLNQDYIRFSRTCGIRPFRIIWQYALRNGIRPVLTMLGLFFAQLLGGVVFVETVFNWPGMGRFAVESIAYLDYSPIQGFIIFMAAVYVMMNLVVDVLYMIIDPRVRY
jgi:peptide/nickel transport system permease protein